MNAKIEKEIDYIKSKDFKLGEFIYMGMGVVKGNNHEVCLSVGYKIDYCIKKAKQFEGSDTHVNKVRVGELKKMDEFNII